MEYEFLKKLNRNTNSIIYYNDDICFTNGYSLSIQAGEVYSSTPKVNYKDNSEYECFELAIKYENRIICEYKDDYISDLYTIYGEDGIFFDIPAKYIDEIYSIMSAK